MTMQPNPPAAGPQRRRPGRHDTPFGTGIRLGHWAEVPILAHWTVLITLLLFAELLSASELPAARPGQPAAAYWLTGLATSTVFLLTLVAHELAHAVTARHFGMRVEKITLWMLGGLTELDGEPPSPRADALIAVAGPATSMGFGVLFGLLAAEVGTSGLFGAALVWLAAISILLGVFNLLPGAPLDGGRLLRALLWRRTHDRARAADSAARAGRVLGFTLVTLGFLEVLAGGMDGLWLGMIGWFIVTGSASERYSARGERLRGLAVADVMRGSPVIAAEWWTAQHFLDQLPAEHAGQPAFPLVDIAGHTSGVITLRDLERAPADRRPTTRLRELARRNHAPVFSPNSPLTDVVLELHLRGGVGIVVEDRRPIGIVTDDDIARAEQLVELGWPPAGPPAVR